MDLLTAKQFADAWIGAWNDHDIDEILSHYADEIEFHSPLIQLLNFNETGLITNKADLKRYFEIGLQKYPELHFKFHNLLIGIHTLVIYYTSVNGRVAAEVFELNAAGKAVKVYCNYSEAGA